MIAWQVLSRILSGQPFSRNPQLSSQLKEQIAQHLRAGGEDLAVQYQWAISLFPGTGAFQSFDNIRERAVAKISSEINISLLTLHQQLTTDSRDPTVAPIPMLIDTARLSEVRTLQVTGYDLTRLVQLCEELNACYQVGAYHAVIMLTRAILDHVPPLFGYKSFTEVANNYAGTRSFKRSMDRLQGGARNIADLHLHGQIRAVESLPNATQVNFSQHLDLLLAEIVRLHKVTST